MQSAEYPACRATSLDHFFALHERAMGKGSYPQGAPFRARPSDVFITPFAKSGTTWLQQIAHGLRSGGDMDFAEISYVVPCLDYAHAMGLDPNAGHRFSPRLFMTHATWAEAPRGGRYICAFRNPKDVITSYYRFLEDWFFDPGTIALDDFAAAFLPAPGRSMTGGCIWFRGGSSGTTPPSCCCAMRTWSATCPTPCGAWRD